MISIGLKECLRVFVLIGVWVGREWKIFDRRFIYIWFIYILIWMYILVYYSYGRIDLGKGGWGIFLLEFYVNYWYIKYMLVS